MNFKCDICDYTTNEQFNYKRHLGSKKHIEKVNMQKNYSTYNSKYNCKYCDNAFFSSSNLIRHMKSCTKQKEMEEKLELENEILKRELFQKNKMISILESDVTHLKLVVNNTGTIAKTSVSALSYVLQNYTKAPALELMTEYAALNYDQDHDKFIPTIIHEYNHKHLDAYIGNFIVRSYKKDDPSEQSLWNSDTSRLTYIVRDIVANNKVDWKVDKKGLKTNELIIAPILKYVDGQLRNYLATSYIDYVNCSHYELKTYKDNVNIIHEITKKIETKALNDDILKYIAPFFYVNREDQ